MIDRLRQIRLDKQQKLNPITSNFVLSPDFFAHPSPIDKIKDIQKCRTLSINTQGMDRDVIKASILASLTGKSVPEMRAFFTGVGEQDMQKDLQLLSQMGMEPSKQSNMMMARAENKANIVNGWIAGIKTENPEDTQQMSVQSGLPIKKSGGVKPPPQTPSDIADFMKSIGLQPTNSKEGDYSAISSKLSEMMASAKDPNEKQIVQDFMATFSKLFS